MNTRHWMFPALAALAVLGCSDTASAQPQLIVSPAAVTNSNTPLAFTNIPSGGVSGSLPVTVSTANSTQATVILGISASAQSWLQITPGASVNIPATLSVRCNTSNLTAGSYSGSFTITVDEAPSDFVTVYVSLTVTGVSALSASPSSLSFTGQAGATGGTPSSTQVQISSTGTQLTYNLQAQTNDGNNWLLLSTTQGSTSGAPFSVSVNPAAVAPNNFPAIFTGTIVATSATTSDSVAISVQLTINANSSLTVTPKTPPPFLYQAGTAADPPSQQLSITAQGGSTTFAIQESPAVSWLVLSALNGTASSTAQTITINATPHEQALQPGTYTTSLIVTPAGEVALAAIPITLVVAAHPLIQLSANTLSFTAPFAGNPSVAQSVIVTSSGSSQVGFTVSSNETWLTASASSATTPATLTVQANPAGLNIQNYTGVLTLTPTNGDPYTETINVSLNVTSSTQLVAGPADLLFSFEIGKSPTPLPSQTIEVSTNGQPVQFTVSAATSNCGPNWLTATPSTAITNAPISVSVLTTGMTAGACSGAVTLSYQTGLGPFSLVIPVSLVVSNAAELSISMAPNFGVISIPLGSGQFQQQISLTSTDPNTQVDYTANIMNVAGGAWLGIAGSSSGFTPDNLIIQVTPGILSIPGTYGGTLVISSSTLGSTQLSIPIALTVTTTTSVTLSSNSLTFTEPQGGAASAAQTLTLTSSPTTATYTAAINYLSGGNWLQISSNSGNANSSIQVSIQPNSLSQGQYTAQISFAFQDAATTSGTVTVVLNVTAGQTVAASVSSLNYSYQIGSTAPASQPITITSTGGASTVAVSATSSGWLSVSSQGGTTPQTINVSVNPQGLAVNTYSGTISISDSGVLSSPILITVTLTVTGQPPPVPNIIINNATGNSGAIAPGEEIAIKGTFLGPASPANGTSFTLNSSGGVSSTLAGVQVLFDNIPGTPVFVSATQINVLVPYEINGRLSTVMEVTFDGAPSQQFTLAVAAAAPGLFTNSFTGQGQVAALNQNFTFNGASGTGFQAAPRGTVISLYGTGGGQSNPVSATGSVTPVPTSMSQLLNISGVTATVGGLPATVEFAGEAPGLITGVIQVNVLIPQGVTPGSSVPVTIVIGSVSSPIGTTIAVQ